MGEIKTNIPEWFIDEAKEHTRKYYSGEIKIPCDEDCSEDCNGEHGNYELPQEFPYKKIFASEVEK